MRRRSRSTTTILARTLAGLLAGCGASADPSTTATTATTAVPSTSDPAPGATVGPVPARVAADGPAVTMASCRPDPDHADRVLVEGVVVNRATGSRLLQGVPLVVRDGHGLVISDDGEDLWSSVTIGPGRRALVRDAVSVDGSPADVTCELGPPDLRKVEPIGEIDPTQVTLAGCAPIRVRVRNPHDVEAGVTVLVEAFDAAGFSVGTFELGQWPTEYTKPVGAGGTSDEALLAGQTGSYEVSPAERISEWSTPTRGPVTSCEVVGGTVVAGPEPRMVIVD